MSEAQTLSAPPDSGGNNDTENEEKEPAVQRKGSQYETEAEEEEKEAQPTHFTEVKS